MINHKAPITSIEIVHGNYLVTAGYDNQIIISELNSNRVISTKFHDDLINFCKTNKSGDKLWTCSSDHTCRVWSIPDLKLEKVLNDHSDDVEMVAISPSEELFATCSQDKTIIIYYKCYRKKGILEGHKSDILTIEWIDDESLISCGDDGTVRLWDVRKMEEKETLFDSHSQTDTLVCTPDFIFTGNDHGEIIDKNKVKYSAHKAGIKRLVLSQDKKWLASLSYDGFIKLWSINSNNCLTLESEIEAPFNVWLRSAKFFKDKELYVTSFGGGVAKLNLKTLKWNLDLVEQTSAINTINCFNDNLFWAGDSGRVFKNGEIIYQANTLINSIEFLESTVLISGQQGRIECNDNKFLPLDLGSPVNRIEIMHLYPSPVLLACTYNGELMRIGINGNNLELLTSIKIHSNSIKSFAIGEKYITTISSDGDVAFIEKKEFIVEKVSKHAHSEIGNCIVHIGNDSFASVGRDRILNIWSDQKKSVFKSTHKKSIKSIAFNNLNQLLCGSYDGIISAFDTNNMRWMDNMKIDTRPISYIKYCEHTNSFLVSTFYGDLYEIRIDITYNLKVKRLFKKDVPLKTDQILQTK